jgi:putative transposase
LRAVRSVFSDEKKLGKPDALLHHSDRGSQYSSEQFQKLLADHGVICSMSRSGNVWDNAAIPDQTHSFKLELLCKPSSLHDPPPVP